MNIFLPQVSKCVDIALNIFVSVGTACLDCIVYIHTFNSGDVHSLGRYLCFERFDPFPAPFFTGCGIVQGCDYACYPGNLTNLLQCYRIKFCAVPSECHFHIFSSCLLYPAFSKMLKGIKHFCEQFFR